MQGEQAAPDGAAVSHCRPSCRRPANGWPALGSAPPFQPARRQRGSLPPVPRAFRPYCFRHCANAGIQSDEIHRSPLDARLRGMTIQGASPASGRSERCRRLQDFAEMTRHLDLVPGDFLGNPRVSWQWAFGFSAVLGEIGYPGMRSTPLPYHPRVWSIVPPDLAG